MLGSYFTEIVQAPSIRSWIVGPGIRMCGARSAATLLTECVNAMLTSIPAAIATLTIRFTAVPH